LKSVQACHQQCEGSKNVLPYTLGTVFVQPMQGGVAAARDRLRNVRSQSTGCLQSQPLSVVWLRLHVTYSSSCSSTQHSVSFAVNQSILYHHYWHFWRMWTLGLQLLSEALLNGVLAYLPLCPNPGHSRLSVRSERRFRFFNIQVVVLMLVFRGHLLFIHQLLLRAGDVENNSDSGPATKGSVTKVKCNACNNPIRHGMVFKGCAATDCTSKCIDDSLVPGTR